jgi:hypothetical protein
MTQFVALNRTCRNSTGRRCRRKARESIPEHDNLAPITKITSKPEAQAKDRLPFTYPSVLRLRFRLVCCQIVGGPLDLKTGLAAGYALPKM